jgi:hypothetical protein
VTAIRLATPDDEAFIAYSWLRSFEQSDQATLCTPHDGTMAKRCDVCGRWSAVRGASSGEYKHGQRRLIAYLMQTSTTLVAEATDVSGGMLDGFACFARGPGELGTPLGQGWEPVWVVHFVYVRMSARGQGVARALLADVLDSGNVRVSYTHRTPGIEACRLPRNFKYDPFETYRQLAKGKAA